MTTGLKLCQECFAEFEDSDLKLCPDDGTELVPIEPDDLIGSRIADRYLILSVLGRGGMGIVYKAQQEQMERPVALKMLHTYLVSDTDAVKRFHREAKAVSRVKHPNSVTLFDFGISKTGQPYIVMDLIEGTNLKKVIKSESPLQLPRVNHIFQQVISALAAAHEHGVIHRDLKPENIMLTHRMDDPEWVQLVDFGISKLQGRDNQTTYNITRVGDVCGSPPYMSPEQCLTSEDLDARSDIYALGVVLYQALTGSLPFTAKSAIEMIDCHLWAPPTPLKIANPELAACESLSNLLNKALAKEPDKRQQSMGELGEELSQAIRMDLPRLRSFRAMVSASLADQALEEVRLSKLASTAALADDQSSMIEKTSSGPQSFLSKLSRLLRGRSRPEELTENYSLLTCPYCSFEVKPGVRFCLNCQRNLASAEELNKLRVSQQVFTLPRHQKHSDAHQVGFSSRAKSATSKPLGLFGGKQLLIINLILLIALCFLYSSQYDSVIQTTLKRLIHLIQHDPWV